MTNKQLIIFSIWLIVLTGIVAMQDKPTLGQRVSTAWESNNGILTFSYRVGFADNKASSYVCEIQSPAATSTVIHASALFLKATSTTGNFQIGKSSSKGAITTLFAEKAISASTLEHIVASTTLQEADNWVIGANEYVNFLAPNGGWRSNQGVCEVIFRVI